MQSSCRWSSCPLSSTDIDFKVIAYLIADSCCTQHLGRSLGAGSMSLSFLCLWCWVRGPAHDKSSENTSWMSKCILAPWPVIYVNFRSSKSQNRRVQDELSLLKDLIAQLNSLLYLLWIKSLELKGLPRDWKILAGFATTCFMTTYCFLK